MLSHKLVKFGSNHKSYINPFALAKRTDTQSDGRRVAHETCTFERAMSCIPFTLARFSLLSWH